jgi:hypothetical protein
MGPNSIVSHPRRHCKLFIRHAAVPEAGPMFVDRRPATGSRCGPAGGGLGAGPHTS